MRVNGHFFSMPSEEADRLLVEIRETTKPRIASNNVVLLAVLDGPDPYRRGKPSNSVSHFKAVCRKAFEQSGASFPDMEGRKHPDTIACAWYPAKSSFAFAAAVQIQQSLLEVPINARKAVFLSIARHELAAFRLVRSAGDNQIVFDPDLWPGLDIHQPDYSVMRERLETVSGGIADMIPWDQISVHSSELGKQTQDKAVPSVSATS